jgi:hypothetical protein
MHPVSLGSAPSFDPRFVPKPQPVVRRGQRSSRVSIAYGTGRHVGDEPRLPLGLQSADSNGLKYPVSNHRDVLPGDCYLLTIEPQLAEEAYRRVTDLHNLEVYLLFFDTTSTYFETGEADEPGLRDKDGRRVAEDSDEAVKEAGFRTHGKSKDLRDDLPVPL